MFDPASRYAAALAPDALTTLATSLGALVKAIDECERTRTDIEHDPAVLLIARHLGQVASTNRPEHAPLRRACIEAAATAARTPLLEVLARRGVGYDAEAKAAFHAEARKAMKRLAASLDLARGDHEVRICAGGIAVSGEIILHSDDVYVQLSLGCMGPGREVMFRRVSGRHDYTGGTNHWASLAELLDHQRFAERVRRELGLAPASVALGLLPTMA